MNVRALATDYDGTLAHDGVVDAETVDALARFRASGRALVLVTGRQRADLARVFPRLDVFDRVVAENGALVHAPEELQPRRLADPPPRALLDALARRGVPFDTGEVVIATSRPHDVAAREAIADVGVPWRVVLNKSSVMLLPVGVDKATGLARALAEIGLSLGECAAVGDAENDLAMLEACGFSAAVANAVADVKARARFVCAEPRGAGVRELVRRLGVAASPSAGERERDA